MFQNLLLILGNPYIFIPIIILICFIVYFGVVNKNSFSNEDLMFIGFAIIFCLIIKISTVFELIGYVIGPNSILFIFSYLGINILKDCISYCEYKLDSCKNKNLFFDLFSVKGFRMTIPFICLMYFVLINKCFELTTNEVNFILITEFIVIPISIIQVIYNFEYIKERTKDKQWRKNHPNFLLNEILFDSIQLFILLIHYLLLVKIAFDFSFWRIVRTIWAILNVIRISITLYFKIKSTKNYFIHLQLSASLKVVDLNSGECPICYGKLKKKCIELQCKHSFHYSCVKNWFDENTICPLCKRDVLISTIDEEYYVAKLSFPHKLIIRIYQYLFQTNNTKIEKEINQIKEIFPMLPLTVIIQQLEEKGNATDVIEYYTENPILLNQYMDLNNEIQNNLINQNNTLVDEIEDDIEYDDDDDITIEELMKLTETRKRNMIQQNL